MTRLKKLTGIAIVLTSLAAFYDWPATSSAQQAAPGTGRPGVALPAPNAPGGYGASGWTYYPAPAHSEQEAKAREIITKYKATEDEKERGKLVDDLTTAVSEQFDARQEAREGELKQLEEQLRKLRELHARRAKGKDEIVRDRVRQLLRDADGLGWGADEAVPQAPRPGTRSVYVVPDKNVPVEKVPVDAKPK
jgi:hypothetical protein